MTAVTPVRGGTDTTLWRVRHGELDSALRVFRPGETAVCERELAAMEAARLAHIPVPMVRAAGKWQDRPVLLLSWCPGVPLAEAIQRHPWRVWSLGKAFGRTQAQIHQITGPDSTRPQRPDWIDWAGTDDQHLHNALQEVAQSKPVRLHLDYHPLNVLTDGVEITGVLDWANTRVGDPRADVARTYTILMVEPYTPGRQPVYLSLFRRLLTRSWQRGYAQVAGKLTNMAWFYVWAGKVMARDLAPRVADPDSWWRPEHIARIQDWTAKWRQKAEKLAAITE